MHLNLLARILLSLVFFLVIVGKAQAKTDVENQFEILGLPFGASLDQVEENENFECNEQPEILDDFVYCFSTTKKLGIEDSLKHINKIILYFHEKKFMYVKMRTEVFEESRPKKKAKAVIIYVRDLLQFDEFPDIKNTFDIKSEKYAMIAFMGMRDYSASKMAGLMPFYIEFEISNNKLFKHFAEKIKIKKEKKQNISKNKLKIFNKNTVDSNTNRDTSKDKIEMFALKWREAKDIIINYQKEKHLLSVIPDDITDDVTGRGLTLLFDKKEFYKTPEKYDRSQIPLAYASISTQDINLIILENHPGGNGGSQDYLFILIKEGSPILLYDKKAWNNGYSDNNFGKRMGLPKENIKILSNKILIKLGFINGKKRIARVNLEKGTLSVIDKISNENSIPEDICYVLYEAVLSACKEKNCLSISKLNKNKKWWYHFGNAIGSRVAAAMDYPHFPQSLLLKACKQTCQTGNKPPRTEFQNTICSY